MLYLNIKNMKNKKDKNKIFDVILVLKEGADPNQLKLKNYTQIMENILNLKLTKKEFKKLEQNKNILSIEINEELNTL